MTAGTKILRIAGRVSASQHDELILIGCGKRQWWCYFLQSSWKKDPLLNGRQVSSERQLSHLFLYLHISSTGRSAVQVSVCIANIRCRGPCSVACVCYRASRALCHWRGRFTLFLQSTHFCIFGPPWLMRWRTVTASAPGCWPNVGSAHTVPKHCNLQNGATSAGFTCVSTRFVHVYRTNQN